MFPSRKLILLASVFAFLFSFNAGAATTSDPTVAELVRLLQDGSDYLMKMVAQSDPRVAEILLTKQTDGETKSVKSARIFGPQLGITLRAGECRVVKNITSALRKVECDSPSIAYSVLPGGVTAKGETAELFAGETCGVSEADRDLVEISKADRLISFDDPLIVGLSDFA